MSNQRIEPSTVEVGTSSRQAEALGQEQGAPPVMDELLRAALEAMADSVVISASDGRVLYANPAARRLMPPVVARPNDPFASYGLFLADGVTPLTVEDAPVARALAGEEVHGTELVRRLPGLAEQSFRVNSSLIRDSAGAIEGVVSVGRENTQARVARDALVGSEALFRGRRAHVRAKTCPKS